MEYSGLVEAIKQDDQKEVNRLLESLIPKLTTYLQLQLNAGKQDAEDCAQQAFWYHLKLLEKENWKSQNIFFLF